MSVDTDVDFWIGYVVETAYRSGSGSTAFDETALTGTMTKIDRCKSCVIKPAKPIRVKEFDLGSGLYPISVETVGRGPGEMILTCFLQTDDFYDWAKLNDFGEEMTSWAFHCDNGISEFDLFGCYVKEWKAEAVNRTETMQTITIAYGAIGDGGALSDVGYNTEAISVASDVSATIDGHTTTALAALRIAETITNTVLEEEEAEMLGVKGIAVPALNKRTVAVELDYRKRDSNVWGAFNTTPSSSDMLNETAQHYSGSIIWASTLTSSLTNVIVDDTNSGARESHGIVKHTAAFSEGAAFAIA